jgi:hypothetical protein
MEGSSRCLSDFLRSDYESADLRVWVDAARRRGGEFQHARDVPRSKECLRTWLESVDAFQEKYGLLCPDFSAVPLMETRLWASNWDPVAVLQFQSVANCTGIMHPIRVRIPAERVVQTGVRGDEEGRTIVRTRTGGPSSDRVREGCACAHARWWRAGSRTRTTPLRRDRIRVVGPDSLQMEAGDAALESRRSTRADAESPNATRGSSGDAKKRKVDEEEDHSEHESDETREMTDYEFQRYCWRTMPYLGEMSDIVNKQEGFLQGYWENA